MCWESQDLELRISDGNVRIFKICQISNNTLRGYYFPNFTYELDTEYETKMFIQANKETIKQTYKYIGTKGFHSYSAEKCVAKLKHDGFNDERIAVWHKRDFFIHNFFWRGNDLALVTGYIPKNSTYYINSQGEIISNCIVLTEIEFLCVGHQNI